MRCSPTQAQVELDSPGQRMRMQTELKGAYQTGFNLTEKDLRRIVDIISEKAGSKTGQQISNHITYRLENGAVVETDTVEDVLAEENVGSKRITSLYYNLWSEGKANVELRFVDTRKDKEQNNSIFYRMRGEDRDALFVLAAELDERIKSIGQIDIKRETVRKGILYTFLLISLFVLTIPFMTAPAFNDVSAIRNTAEQRRNAINDVIQRYDNTRARELSDLFEFFIQLERARQGPAYDERASLEGLLQGVWWAVALAIAGFIASMLAWLFLGMCYYPFNYVWGEQIAVVDRRQRLRNVLLVGVGVALIVGMISSYVAGLLPRL